MKKILVDDIIDTGIENIFSKESRQKFDLVYYEDFSIENIPGYYNILLDSEKNIENLYEKNAFFLFSTAKQPFEAKYFGTKYNLIDNIFTDPDLEEIFTRFDVEPIIANIINPNLTDFVVNELNQETPIPLPAAILYDKFGSKTLILSGNHYSQTTIYQAIVNNLATEDRIEWLSGFSEEYLQVKKNQFYLNIKKMSEFGIQILTPLINEGKNYAHISDLYNGKNNCLEKNLSIFFRTIIHTKLNEKEKKYLDLPYKY